MHIVINSISNLGFTAFFNIINEGKLNVVTAIMNDKTVPSSAPLVSKASATGIVPKISAYIGIPTIVAKTTPKGLFSPSIPVSYTHLYDIIIKFDEFIKFNIFKVLCFRNIKIF